MSWMPPSRCRAGGDPLLAVRELSVDFRTDDGWVRAVNGVSMNLTQSETLGIVGESGSGKTQTALAMLGLLDSNARAQGSAQYRGQEMIGLKARALNRVRGGRIAMIFQDPMTALNPHLKVGTQLIEGLRQHLRIDARAACERASEWLAAVHLPDPKRLLKLYPHELSGGQRQRVMIAMSLLCEPEILIADEPTTALDVTVQAEVLDLLAELKQRLRMALVLITHDLGVIATMCDRVMVMYAGRIVESGPAQVIFQRPQHPYTKSLLACIPRLDAPTEETLPVIPGAPPSAGYHSSGCEFAPRCPYALARCERERPHLVEFAADRAKACHLDRMP
jgi:oligopeptide transport system ATP-binding protein